MYRTENLYYQEVNANVRIINFSSALALNNRVRLNNVKLNAVINTHFSPSLRVHHLFYGRPCGGEGGGRSPRHNLYTFSSNSHPPKPHPHPQTTPSGAHLTASMPSRLTAGERTLPYLCRANFIPKRETGGVSRRLSKRGARLCKAIFQRAFSDVDMRNALAISKQANDRDCTPHKFHTSE